MSGPSREERPAPPRAQVAARAAAEQAAATRLRLGEVLVQSEILTPRQLEQLLAEQQSFPTPRPKLGQLAVRKGVCTELQIATALSSALGLELVDLRERRIDTAQVRLLPRAVAERFGVIVLVHDATQATVVTYDPTNVVALDEVRVRTGARRLVVLVAPESQLRDALARAWSEADARADVDEIVTQAEPEELEEAIAGDPDAAPVVRLLDDLLVGAVRARASDVHIEPRAKDLRVRYRVDGVLREVIAVPRSVGPGLTSRMKIISGLDIAERRRPQDGRARLRLSASTYADARVSTLPTVHGEKIVVRLLPQSSDVAEMSGLGLSEPHREVLTRALESSQGLVLITGPTGSGKTNTLYSALREITTPERNIVTLEDPVEIELPGITQVQVHERAGLTFAAGLRSVLRQDPDVVLVGEVRDSETAELALRAALTGHLVLTTLHTNDAVAALGRLVDMGVQPFLVASSLSLVLAQRLVRRSCTFCQEEYTPDERTLTALGLPPTTTGLRGRGCQECERTGYRGRLGVFELLPVDARLRAVLLATPTESALRAAAAAAGLVPLRDAAIDAARSGATTFEEVLRATHADAGVEVERCTGCGERVIPEMRVCPVCATPPGGQRCTSCTRPLEAHWRLCPWCEHPREAAAD